jgi:nucleoside-diphosphate-sugar epimerase
MIAKNKKSITFLKKICRKRFNFDPRPKPKQMSHQMILITGANGQIGRVLAESLRKEYGAQHVLCTDITPSQKQHESSGDIADDGPFEILNVQDSDKLNELLSRYKVTQIYHLAAILSASGEADPMRTWNINFNSFISLLEAARKHSIEKIFFPSTIAVFGGTTPRIQTPQASPLLPETVYGISKATGEMWCHYYHKRYGLDIRSIRYPGIIGWQSMPGGGTTDYAVEIFHAALKDGHYTCFLEENTRLPMMYMDDAILATVQLMKANAANIQLRYSYNLSAMSFTPAEIAAEIQKHLPDFTIDYHPDFRQQIAASWSETIDDSQAREDWGWQPSYNLEKMTADMLSHLTLLYSK